MKKSINQSIMARRASIPFFRNTSVFRYRVHYFGMANLTPSKQTSSNVPDIQPRFASGTDEAQLMAEAKALLEGGWKLDEEQRGVEKTFYFNTYTKALV